MQAFRKLLGTNDMLAYVSMMAPRLVELRPDPREADQHWRLQLALCRGPSPPTNLALFFCSSRISVQVEQSSFSRWIALPRSPTSPLSSSAAWAF